MSERDPHGPERKKLCRKRKRLDITPVQAEMRHSTIEEFIECGVIDDAQSRDKVALGNALSQTVDFIVRTGILREALSRYTSLHSTVLQIFGTASLVGGIKRVIISK